MSILGDRIKKERESLNLTREDLAKKIGVSYSTIAMYEQGNREPSNDLTMKMCELFACSLDYLLGKSDIRDPEEEFAKYVEKTERAMKKQYNGSFTSKEKQIMNDILNKLKDNNISEEDAFVFIEKELDKTDNIEKDILNIIIYRYYSKILPLHDNAEKLDMFSEDKEKKDTSQAGFYMCPVYGRIAAGIPNWAEECIEGRIPIDPVLFNIINPEEHFFLRVNGESMNKIIRNGAYALIHKQDMVENGEIAVVLVNGDEATLKKFSKQGDLVVLEPMSDDSSFQVQVYDKNTPIKVLGKYVGKFEINK